MYCSCSTGTTVEKTSFHSPSSAFRAAAGSTGGLASSKKRSAPRTSFGAGCLVRQASFRRETAPSRVGLPAGERPSARPDPFATGSARRLLTIGGLEERQPGCLLLGPLRGLIRPARCGDAHRHPAGTVADPAPSDPALHGVPIQVRGGRNHLAKRPESDAQERRCFPGRDVGATVSLTSTEKATSYEDSDRNPRKGVSVTAKSVLSTGPRLTTATFGLPVRLIPDFR